MRNANAVTRPLAASAESANVQSDTLPASVLTSLARLWQQQGKQTEARQVLGEIYGWFTEGFHTADLKEAASLLNELT